MVTADDLALSCLKLGDRIWLRSVYLRQLDLKSLPLKVVSEFASARYQVTDTPFNDPLSQVVRRQLQDLRIDPDATLIERRSARFGRLKAWCGRHKQGIAIVSAVVMGLFFLSGILTVVALVASGPSGSGARSASQSVTVSLGDATVQIGPPAYRRFSLAEGSVRLHLDVRNTAAIQSRLLAGDLLLADWRGALFPPRGTTSMAPRLMVFRIRSMSWQRWTPGHTLRSTFSSWC